LISKIWDDKMKKEDIVEIGDSIGVYYTGTLEDGSVFDSNVGERQLNFTVGKGDMIKGFEEGVVGMKLNQTKRITIPAKEAYGDVKQDLIVRVPRSQFGSGEIKTGMAVTSNAGHSGVIKALDADSVTIDFNPPLAGKTLIFEIKIAAIRKK
jgi:FKBP-type peptidyl-prolyl cis-trans isomerase 2